ncbi:MAG: T9SS type A sorting domain-containing protein [Bacteroidota bacterium]|nr:T9SS type A sorting domain-containing protein [Bacteroidota bacterium]
MHVLAAGITTLLLTAVTVYGQTPVWTLSDLGNGETLQTSPRIVVGSDGNSIVAWPEKWQYITSDGKRDALVQESIPLLGVIGLENGNWAFLSARDTVWDGQGYIYAKQSYFLQTRDPFSVIEETDTLLTLLSSSSYTDDPSQFQSLEFMQSATHEGKVLISATLRFEIMQYPGPGADWQEQRWMLWRPGQQPTVHAPSEVRWITGACPSDVSLGAFSESGTPFLLHRDQVKSAGNRQTYLRYRLQDTDGSALRIDTLRQMDIACPSQVTHCIAHDDGAMDVIELLPATDSLIVRQYDAAGIESAATVLCDEVHFMPGSGTGSSIPDAACLPIEGGRHLICWTRKNAPDVTRVYISAFDQNWQRIGEPQAVAGGSDVQIGATIARHDDSTIAVAWYEKNPGWKINYRRIPLAQFVTQQPPVGVVLFTHIEDNTPMAALDTPEARVQYERVRDGVIAFAKKVAEYGLSWSLQPDWKFLLAALRFETDLLSPATNGKALLTWLREDMGMSIDAHSHEKQGYNYTDVAHLLDSLGVGGSTVIGGHVWDPALPQFQEWDRFRVPVQGSMYPWASWRGDILLGSGTPNHVNDPVVSGIWRPLDRWHYFDDDPQANMTCVGQYTGDMEGVRELVRLRRGGAVRADSILTASLHITPSQLLLPAERRVVEDSILIPLARMRNLGDILVTDFTSLVEEWYKSYDGAASVFRPGISTDVTSKAHAMPRTTELIVYPNPVRDALSATFVTAPGTTAWLGLYDVLGRLLQTIPVAAAHAQTVSVSVADRAPGLYFLRLHSPAGTVTRRVMVLPQR